MGERLNVTNRAKILALRNTVCGTVCVCVCELCGAQTPLLKYVYDCSMPPSAPPTHIVDGVVAQLHDGLRCEKRDPPAAGALPSVVHVDGVVACYPAPSEPHLHRFLVLFSPPNNA